MVFPVYGHGAVIAELLEIWKDDLWREVTLDEVLFPGHGLAAEQVLQTSIDAEGVLPKPENVLRRRDHQVGPGAAGSDRYVIANSHRQGLVSSPQLQFLPRRELGELKPDDPVKDGCLERGSGFVRQNSS